MAQPDPTRRSSFRHVSPSTSPFTDPTRKKSLKKRLPDEDSWTSVDRKELDHATSYVSESMYLVMENPVSSLYLGESVQFKAHALCDQSSVGSVSNGNETCHGTLFLTNYRLLFWSFDKRDASKGNDGPKEIQLNNIAELAEYRVNNGKLGPLNHLEVACKNFEIVRFGFPSENTSGELFVRINQLLGAKQLQSAYVFPDTKMLPDICGWSTFDPLSEFQRLGFKIPRTDGQLTGFRITTINMNYKFSPTYPSTFIVPTCISDGELRKISHFRARGRVPAVTYRHRNDAVLVRCAQPLVGLRRKRCASDEAYMAALRRETKGKLLFVDCRSQTSAYGNIALGGGFEVLDYYKDTNITFMGIENIHSMRDSIKKLFELIKNEVRGNERANWWSSLEGTRWLEHVRSVLVSCSLCVSKLVDEDTSLVIHCSDGWDRTAQLVSLTKLCVDPFYRTIKGFQVLIDQEWCAFGHQFAARSGHSNDRTIYWEDEHTSPVFMQFIDAVWQLLRQFPCSFEFNEKFLINLLDEVYSKRSGTFLHDSEEMRVGCMTFSRCISAWTLLNLQQTNEYMNPFYIMPVDTSGAVTGPSWTTTATKGGALGALVTSPPSSFIPATPAQLTPGGNGTGSSSISAVNAGSSPDRSPVVLQFKWHTSSLAIWSSFYLRSLESNESRDAWAKELQVTHKEMQEKLSTAHQKLQSQIEVNSELHQELEVLRKERERLQQALEGQVFSDKAKGMFIHEEDAEEEDGVLLSVTPVHGGTGSSSMMMESPPLHGLSPPTPSSLPPPLTGSFISASMTSHFEIIKSYFDPITGGTPPPPPPLKAAASSGSVNGPRRGGTRGV